MSALSGQNLRFLVVEDSSFFRSAVSSMLSSLGISLIDAVHNGSSAIEACRSHAYDIILCDYDLGSGKSGQQVLEALRHYQLLPEASLFIMVTGDTSRQAVLATSEYAADDYLSKPINATLLEKRIARLRHLQKALKPIFLAIGEERFEEAIKFAAVIAAKDKRASQAAHKMVGELLLQTNQVDRAETFYNHVIADKALEWARLGLGHVYQAKGDLDRANEVFSAVLQDNPMSLAAHDALAKNYHLQEDNIKLQESVLAATKLSPYSIMRQKNLANIAEENGDIDTAIKALRECVKLGFNSCHGDWNDAYRFGMNTADAPAELLQEQDRLPSEALKILKDATDFFNVSKEDLLCIQFLQGRLQYLSRQKAQGQQAIYKTESLYLQSEKQNIVTDIARVKAIRTLNEDARAKQLAEELAEYYADNQEALQKLDNVLDEPLNKENRKLLTEANKKGIKLYNKKQFDEAINCFQRAKALFPRHIGVQLNICQAYLGKLAIDYDEDLAGQVTQQLNTISSNIDGQHSQFERYRKLQEMARETLG